MVILTAHGSKQDEAEARRLGAFAYLKKPVGLESLMQTITSAYRRKIELTMAASALAEGGDFDSARELLDEADGKQEE